MDADGDGNISKEEFMNQHEKKFMEKDAKGDGMITMEEAKEAKKDKMKKWKDKKDKGGY